MSRRFIATVLIVATTIAGFSAAPARAATDADIAKLLGAAATIFIIGKAIESSRDKKKDKKKKDAAKEHQHQDYYSHKSDNIPNVVPRDFDNRHRDIALPKRCVRRIDGGHVRRVVMKRCLKRHDVETKALPRACKMTVNTKRGHRPAYAMPCLRNRGYNIARY